MDLNISMVAEIGINANGSLQNAIEMIRLAKEAGFQFVKFQKRNPDLCVPENKKSEEKRVPWRDKPITYLQYKKDIEFNYEYATIDTYCKEQDIFWFVSVWDMSSAEYMKRFHQTIVKIPSAKLTDDDLLKYCRDSFKYVMLSTGMSNQVEIDHAVEIGSPNILMHTNSSYPTVIDNVHLGYLLYLQNQYAAQGIEIGYSNHCPNVAAVYTAATYPIKWIELHVTLDNTKWGSDQAASFNLSTLRPTLETIQTIASNYVTMSKGYEPRKIYEEEESKRVSLRG